MQKRILIAFILLIGTISPSIANNLILAPTGTTLTTGQLRAEAAISADGSNSQYYWFGTGLKQYELNATRFQKAGQETEDVVDIQFSFLPETMITPAVAFGVRDLGDQSGEGVGPYVAITRHLSLGPAEVFVKDFAATVGFGAFGIRGAFCGFQAGLPGNIILQGEYDSRNFNAAIGWQPMKLFRLKAYSIRKDTYVGAELVPVTF